MIATLLPLIKSLIASLGKEAAFDFIIKQVKKKLGNLKETSESDIQAQDVGEIVQEVLKENYGQIQKEIKLQYKKLFWKLFFIFFIFQIISFLLLLLVIK